MLGYLGGEYTHSSQFGQVSDDFGMDDVQCTGNEDSIFDCPHRNEDIFCDESEGLGAICYGGGWCIFLSPLSVIKANSLYLIFYRILHEIQICFLSS